MREFIGRTLGETLGKTPLVRMTRETGYAVWVWSLRTANHRLTWASPFMSTNEISAVVSGSRARASNCMRTVRCHARSRPPMRTGVRMTRPSDSSSACSGPWAPVCTRLIGVGNRTVTTTSRIGSAPGLWAVKVYVHVANPWDSGRLGAMSGSHATTTPSIVARSALRSWSRRRRNSIPAKSAAVKVAKAATQDAASVALMAVDSPPLDHLTPEGVLHRRSPSPPQTASPAWRASS